MRYAEGRWTRGRWERHLARQFSVAGRVASQTNNDNEVHSQLWNPDSVRSFWVLEVTVARSNIATANNSLMLVRSTARGATPAATIAPDLDSDFAREVTPDSGAVLEVGNFGTEPTLAGPPIGQTILSQFASLGGSSYQWVFPKGLRVPPGTGLCLAVTGGGSTAFTTDSFFRFEE